jgi:iron complex outermembrane receptor protein
LFLLFQYSYATNCTYTLNGNIVDEHDKTGLDFSTIYIVENKLNYIADENGFFEIQHLCLQEYTLIISHLACKTDTIKINLNKDLTVNLYLEHHAEELQEIEATANKTNQIFNSAIQLNEIAFQKNYGKDIATILSNINSVRVLKTGSNINKPIVNGFLNDRVTLVNNGMVLNTQDWGFDHAPEIDANNIVQAAIINNAEIAAYITQNTGAVLKLENAVLPLIQHQKVGILSAFQTNGLKSSFSSFWQQGFEKKYTYKIQFSYKKSADFKTPDYVMSNTGMQEIACSFAQKFTLKKHTTAHVNYSFFSQDLGVLRAAHVGNIEDFNKAIASDTPLIILPQTFSLINPRQNVLHQFADVKIIQALKKQNFIELRTNFQHNKRKEYDIRRGARYNIPALDMNLMSYFLNVFYNREKYITKKQDWLWKYKIGMNYQYKNNTNNVETGVSPLIPDYLQHNVAFFNIHEFSKKNIKIDLSSRVEYNYLLAYTFDNKKLLIKNRHHFNAYFLTFNVYSINKIINMQSGITFSSKVPNINELYSNGLHHGTASLEYGNSNLKLEKAFQFNNIFQYNYKKYINIIANWRMQFIKDYIYLSPSNTPTLTIRGAFPTFNFNATNALMQHLTLNIIAQATSFLEFKFDYNMTRARDVRANDYIINMPADAFRTSVKFFTSFKHIADAYVSIGTQYVLQQNKTPQNIIDYKAAPNQYFLLDTQIGATANINEKHKIIFSIHFDNLLNTTYRDYLNRLRYFTDEMGFNATFRLNYFFN